MRNGNCKLCKERFCENEPRFTLFGTDIAYDVCFSCSRKIWGCYPELKKQYAEWREELNHEAKSNAK